MPPPPALALRTAALLTCLVGAAGCNTGSLQFTNDNRLSFQDPDSRQHITVPVTIRWTMKDFDAVGLDGSRSKGKGAFAVFVDQAPLPVGKDLKWLGRDDSGCQRDPRCPDEQFLAVRNVHVTTQTSLTLDVLPRVGAGVGDEQHYVTVVLLDGTGHRIGESAWYRPFTSTRRSST
jgi:hypothetical protein